MAVTSAPPVSVPAQIHTLLRFATAGSVDDGKSTLIGRLLHDSSAVADDQLAHVEDVSARRGGNGEVDLSLLTDGLRAEREQGITIDVAYRYFATPRRRFIIADTPGHVQYTRNMVTGASTAELSVVLVDARLGVQEQSRRHAYLAGLLRIPHLLVAVNKMDLVDWDQEVFDKIVSELSSFTNGLGFVDVKFVPVSALLGDNVVERSENMSWYDGPPLIGLLEETPMVEPVPEDEGARLPVQWVVRPRREGFHDYRGYAGQVAGGVFRVGDEVDVMPAGQRTRVAAIDTFDGELESARAPLSVTFRLEADIDVSRGDMICGTGNPPGVTRELEADVCWMVDEPLRKRSRYTIKHTSRSARAVVDELEFRMDVETLERDPAATELGLNDIGRVHLRTSAPLVIDPYSRNRTTGAFILIDEQTNETVGAGMVVDPLPEPH